MARYTLFIPKEFFIRKIISTEIFFLIILIIAMMFFFGYKLLKVTKFRKKAESF